MKSLFLLLVFIFKVIGQSTDEDSLFNITKEKLENTFLFTKHPQTNLTHIPYTNTSDPLVQFRLECQLDETFCNKISKVVRAAIDEFTRVVNIKNGLLIHVTYYSFCDVVCANDTFGWGSPTSQFTLPFEDGADLNYVYPQSLAKQLAPYSSTSVWSTYDVEIEINHDVYMNYSKLQKERITGTNETGIPLDGKFWLYNGTEKEIESEQVDLRYVVLHQLLHGVGFVSSWAAYFWTNASPFRMLVDGVIDPIELQLVTPGPYWYINQDGGPAYITGFQPTMIFDKFLVNHETELNMSSSHALSELGFEMQDFCVQNHEAFIVNFIRLFNEANQSTKAHKLWLSLSNTETLDFHFQPTTVNNSSFYSNSYLNQTYQHMTLLTGEGIFSNRHFEHTHPTLNRPGLMISHLDDQYLNTVDFLMTKHYHLGQTLEELINEFYNEIPIIQYLEPISNTNLTFINQTYKSPIGPGILRILDSIGYSTVLTRTNYTTEGNVKTPKSRSICDDKNSNPALKSSSPNPTSNAIQLFIYFKSNYFIFLYIIYLFII